MDFSDIPTSYDDFHYEAPRVSSLGYSYTDKSVVALKYSSQDRSVIVRGLLHWIGRVARAQLDRLTHPKRSEPSPCFDSTRAFQGNNTRAVNWFGLAPAVQPLDQDIRRSGVLLLCSYRVSQKCPTLGGTSQSVLRAALP